MSSECCIVGRSVIQSYMLSGEHVRGCSRGHGTERGHGMFLGEYQHTLDAKGRVSLPAKFRAEVTGSLVVSKGLDNCLYVYSAEEYRSVRRGPDVGQRLQLQAASPSQVLRGGGARGRARLGRTHLTVAGVARLRRAEEGDRRHGQREPDRDLGLRGLGDLQRRGRRFDRGPRRRSWPKPACSRP